MLVFKRIYISKFILFYDLIFFATWLQEVRFEVQKQIDPLKHHHGTSQSLNIDVIKKMAPSFYLDMLSSHFYIILFVEIIILIFYNLQKTKKKCVKLIRFLLSTIAKRGGGEPNFDE